MDFLKRITQPDVATRMPEKLLIEPANMCNCRCPTCVTGSGRLNRRPGLMKLSEFQTIVDQVHPYVRRISLWNYGEPAMNRDLPAMISYAAGHGITTRVSTNGYRLNKMAWAEALVESGLDYLIIDFDGVSQEALDLFRIGANMEDLLAGIRNITACKKKRGLSKPVIELQCILMRHNEDETEEIVSLARSLDVDVFSLKTIYIFSDLDGEKERFVPSDIAKSRYERGPDGGLRLRGKIRPGCRRLKRTAVINCDGTVVPCCYDIYTEYPLGNVFQDLFTDIWNGEKYRAFRRRVRLEKETLGICRKCPEDRASSYVERKIRFNR
jgi:radical SAM protein with 4Fe4S-binding SPASM domain